MPYEPNFGKPSPPLPTENRAVTGYNPNFGKPVNTLGLNLLAPSTARKFITGIAVAGGLLLALIAFTPQGVAQFLHGFSGLLTPNGIRVAAATLLVLGFAGYMYWSVASYGHENVCRILGITAAVLFCVAASGAYYGALSPVYACIVGAVGLFLILVYGIIADATPVPAAPSRPATPPLQSPYDNARNANANEIHTALSGKNNGFEEMFED